MANTEYHLEYYQQTSGPECGPWDHRTFSARSNVAAAARVLAYVAKTGVIPSICINRRTGRSIPLLWAKMRALPNYRPPAPPPVFDCPSSTVALFLGRELAEAAD